MIRLFTKTPELLKEDDIVKFVRTDTTSVGRSDFTDNIPANSTWRVEKVQQLTHDASVILPASDYTIIDMCNEDTGFGLEPTSPHTLYEILVGLKGSNNVLVYLQIPSGKYFSRLEQPKMFPNPAVAANRYIGTYSVEDTPYTEPKLRVNMIKDFEPLIFIPYNDGSDYEKLVFHFLVNKCYLTKTSEPSTGEYRKIMHYESMRW